MRLRFTLRGEAKLYAFQIGSPWRQIGSRRRKIESPTPLRARGGGEGGDGEKGATARTVRGGDALPSERNRSWITSRIRVSNSKGGGGRGGGGRGGGGRGGSGGRKGGGEAASVQLVGPLGEAALRRQLRRRGLVSDAGIRFLKVQRACGVWNVSCM